MKFDELDLSDKILCCTVGFVVLLFIGGGILCFVMVDLPMPDETAIPIPGEFESSQFALIGDEVMKDTYFRVMFIVDQKTGVEYVNVAGDITPRYNTDGSLIIHPEYIEVEK